MEKKKMKVGLIILLLILCIFVIFVIFTARKMIILSNIDKMVTDLESSHQNIYKMISETQNGILSVQEFYLKDNVYKTVTALKPLDSNETALLITTFTYPDKEKMYTESPQLGKLLTIDNEPHSITMINNFGHNDGFFFKLLAGMSSKIKTVEINNKEYYEIKNFKVSDYMYDSSAKDYMVYVEKDTGLPLKVVATFEEDGNITEIVTSYEFKFDVVTDEDMTEPDDSIYTLQ